MKRIKRILMILLISLTYFIGYTPTDAATLSVSGTASATSTVVGNTVSITFKFSSGNPLGAVVYAMSYDSDYLTLTSGTQSNALSYTGSQKSDSVKFVFKAKKKGETTVRFKINEALDFDGNPLSASTVSKTITIKTQADIEASYSKNNNLSSLKVSSGELSPAFNKNTLEYSVTVENPIDKITVSGSKEDSKSYVDGLKEYNLEEGNNRIEVKVTAQNGTAKTYVINVTRKELAPINVKTEEGLDLKVVRKKDLLKAPNDNYEEASVLIGEDEVPAFFNKNTNSFLVGLRNDEGTISLYTYKDNKYYLYKELLFNSIIISPTSSKDIPKGFIKETIKINELDVEGYKNPNNDNYYLINGINIHTGKENLYQYDKNEGTIQIYNSKQQNEINELNEKNTNYLYVIIGLGSLLIITYIAILISSIRKNKKKKKEKVQNNKEEKTKKTKDFDFGEDTLSILDVDTIEEFKSQDNPEEKVDEKEENTSTLQEKKKKRKKEYQEIEKNNKKDDTIEEDIS